ncbi:glycosyltransferase family 4 protein [Streptomyces sp. NPDC006971]|uniref:glycosyltransferase family 4 protein n=1 Tax=Streptomyces sp. NPDC006971 TaxID=3154784 RepID=UPI0033C7E45E
MGGTQTRRPSRQPLWLAGLEASVLSAAPRQSERSRGSFAMKVVMSAYACDPDESSERGIGWWWASAAAERHEVWLLTRHRSRPAIERALKADPRPNLHPVYVDAPRWVRSLKRGVWTLYPYYVIWQAVARAEARRLHQDIRFDVAHHVTFAIDWLPSGMAFCHGLPSVWGPVGPGVTSFPFRMWKTYGPRWVFSETLRSIVTTAGSCTFGSWTAKRAAVIIAQNNEVAERFKDHPNLVVEQNSVVDLPPDLVGSSASFGDKPRRAVFIGRLIPSKGLRAAVGALAQPAASDWTLDVYGRGPEREPSLALARKLGVDDRITLHGVVDRSEVFKALHQADALLFPSSRESAPGVVAEAVTSGCPVICLDTSGPGTVVQPGQGIKLAPSADVCLSLAQALNQVGPRHAGDDRWTARRIPCLLDRWYAMAAGASSSVPAGRAV